ncbi:MAG: nucleoside deaminase [Oscillospiraceae bacterium]|nr:nucleoside deaminase [Oscillospiraceae bacterium]
MTPDEKMAYVIDLAKEALDNGEFPIAAAIYHGDKLISSAYTSERTDGRFLVHAEQKALMDADMQKLPFEVRFKLELYTNLEPCLMCLGMAMSSFIGKVYYALEAPEDGAVDFVRKEYASRPPGIWHFPEVTGGILREQSIQLFRKFVEQNEDNPGVDFAKTLAKL